MARFVIVNADDFGLSPGVNRGIIAAHERGIVTSASLMVRGAAVADAAEYAGAHPTLGVGLHIDLGEWAFRDGAWVELYRVVSADDGAAVAGEVARQVDTFRQLVGRDPTHLDSHQHVHRKEPVRRVVLAIGARLGLPVRHDTPGVAYCGDFYGQDEQGNSYPHLVSAEALMELLERTPQGVTELACHPGEDDLRDTMYAQERRDEVNALCDARVRALVEKIDIRLISFADLGAIRRQHSP